MSGKAPIRILFYPHSARAFSSSLIGHLYELARQYPVVLLTERLPANYAALLENQEFFPQLVRVEVVSGLGFSVWDLIRNNRRWYRLARDVINQTKPQLVVTENDMSSLFDMYLLREAKAAGVKCLTIQGMMQTEATEMRKFVELLYVYRDGGARPRWQRLVLAWFYRIRQWLGHFLVHYLLPWSAGTDALRGSSSYLLRQGASGLRDSDLNLVPSLQAFQSHTASGVPPNKLAFLPHPLARVPHALYFVPTDTGPARPTPSGEKTILVLLTSVQFGFHRHDHSLISAEQRRETRLQIIRLLHRIFPAWQIVVKPHPDCGKLETVQQHLSAVSDIISVLPPSTPVEPHLKDCDLILDLPLSVTTTLFTAACAYPDRPVISANVDNEFYGDHYRDSPEIDYVESMPALETLLRSIKNGTHRKSVPAALPPGLKSFPTTNAAVHYLLQHPH